MIRALINRCVLLGTLAVATLGVTLPADAGNKVVAIGTFEGQGTHVTSGGVLIVHTEDGNYAVLESDFFFDGAPAPRLGFGDDGYDHGTQFATLEADTGAQVYAIPDDIALEEYNEFWLWCEQFDVPLGVARFE